MKFKKLGLMFLVCFTLGFITPIRTFAQNSDYVVKSGDTLSKIAKSNYIGINDILKLNPSIKSASSIYVGQKIKLPDMSKNRAMEDQVLALVNKERAKRGIKPLIMNNNLRLLARMKSMDMRDKGYFSHYSPTYGSPFQMMIKYGIRYSAAGENIAKGQRTASSVMNAWMNSSGHRANILNPNYKEIGVGVSISKDGTVYWTQMFIRK